MMSTSLLQTLFPPSYPKRICGTLTSYYRFSSIIFPFGFGLYKLMGLGRFELYFFGTSSIKLERLMFKWNRLSRLLDMIRKPASLQHKRFSVFNSAFFLHCMCILLFFYLPSKAMCIFLTKSCCVLKCLRNEGSPSSKILSTGMEF